MSVKVAVRVRPFNEREIERNSKCCIQMNGAQTTIMDPESNNPRPFTFDYSFWSHDSFVKGEDGISRADGDDSIYADQEHVHNTLGKQVVDNAWEGYHCCLFAYGQTGSGKSYSMISHEKNLGIVPMTCNEIFERIAKNKDTSNTYQVQVSMLEIYNEKIQDLLII